MVCICLLFCGLFVAMGICFGYIVSGKGLIREKKPVVREPSPIAGYYTPSVGMARKRQPLGADVCGNKGLEGSIERPAAMGGTEGVYRG